jgi:hypothetical protein
MVFPNLNQTRLAEGRRFGKLIDMSIHIGGIPPAEAEARYYARIEDVAMAA